MKIISNDLRSSCRALLVGEHQGGGGTHYDSIFHDIINNSDVVATISIYGDYKLTVNLWETDRADVYEPKFYNYYCSAAQSKDEGYCQNYYYSQYRVVHMVFIAWNGNTPLYAQLSGTFNYLTQEYVAIDVHGSNDTDFPFEYYAYPNYVEKYIKGSAALASEIDHFEFGFKPWRDNVMYFTNYLYPCDSSGNHVGLTASYRTKRLGYTAERPKCEWTNPDTGVVSTIEDRTAVPTIRLSNSTETSRTLGMGNELFLFNNKYLGTFSDFNTNEQLIAAHGEIVRAICLANGMDYKMAPLLVPESEE